MKGEVEERMIQYKVYRDSTTMTEKSRQGMDREKRSATRLWKGVCTTRLLILSLLILFLSQSTTRLWKGVCTARLLILSLLILFLSQNVSAQFFNEGVDSPRRKWHRFDTPRYKLIFPAGFEEGAARYAATLDLVHPWINYNFRDSVRKVPIILRVNSHLSNGFVSWAPKRQELVTNIAGNTYALPWYKQLAAHEGRHVAQMSIMKTGLTKVAMWFMGEAGIALALVVMDDWQMEGDAVLAETQMAEFGRGLQPEFTLGYRGYAAAGKLNFKRIDAWIHGSYKKLIPSIYHYGYQVVSAAETYLAPTVWYDMARFSARHPIFVFPDRIHVQRRYKTNYGDVARRAFAELDSIWQPTYSIENSYRLLTPEKKIHTNYTHPLSYNQNIIAAKWDMDIPNRLVEIDTVTGIERKIVPTGMITSRPIIWKDKLYWTEHKPHLFYQQESNSVVRSYDFKTKKSILNSKRGATYYITPINDSIFASIALDSQSRGYIRLTKSDFRKELSSYHFEEPLTLHGLTWDSLSDKLYYIALSDRGMWVGSLDREREIEQITDPSVVTIQDLRADNKKLYFSSIQSGKNEIHTIDLNTSEEYRQTQSQLGAITPSVVDSSQMIFSAYTPMGWALATTEPENLERVEWSRLPRNILNPERYQWDVPKIDTVKIVADTATIKSNSKRFRRLTHGFNMHSWAPIPVSGDMNLAETAEIKLGVGASLFFQSTLSDLEGFLSYGWVNSMHWAKANISYTALPVRISFDVEYGGKYQKVYLPADPSQYPTFRRKPFLEISARFSLPMNFSLGGNSRLLEPSVIFSSLNSCYFNNYTERYSKSVQTYDVSLYWSTIRNKGSRLILPRLGYTLRFSTKGAIKKDFGTIFALTGRAYLPGIAKNHSLYAAATTQYQHSKNSYKLSSKSLVPRGVTNDYSAKNYVALQLGYIMPLVYPDGGIEGLLYLRRISAEIFRDVSWGSYFTNVPGRFFKATHDSTGATIGIENILFNIFPNTMYFTFAHTSEDKFRFGFSLSFSFNKL